MITIQYATTADAHDLARIMIDGWNSAFRGILPDDIIRKYTDLQTCVDMFHHILASCEGTMYLAKSNDQSIGLLYLVFEENHARIDGLFTLSEVWGRGVGAALIEKALSDAATQGITNMCVWPFDKNTRAKCFYEKQGFIPTGKSRFNDALEVEYIRKLV